MALLRHLRDKARYWSKIVIFSYPVTFDATFRGGVGRRNIAIPFGVEITRMVGLPDGENTLRICISYRLDRILACDRRIDRQTDVLPRHSPRYAYASRGNYTYTCL